MPTTNFSAGTQITSTWLNEVDAATFDGAAVHTPAGTGAVATTMQAKLRHFVSITDYGGAAGAGDNTAAMDAAEAYLATLGGGVIFIPYPGEWKMNWVCTTSNIFVFGPGGRGEYDDNCIRPYNTASAAITMGDGTTDTRYCTLYNCHISGTDQTAGAIRTTTGNAPYAVHIRGGTIDFQMDRCVVYNGVVNMAFIPTNEGASITGTVVSRSHFRNDLAGVSTSRNFYLARYEHNVNSPDLGYLTSTKFINCRVNGPKNTDNSGNPTTAAPSGAGVQGGYCLEAAMLGNVGIVVEVNDSYWDCSDGCGLYITGSSGVVCYNFQLDAGGTGRVIIETDQSSVNVGRYITGNLRHGGQKFKNGSGTLIDIPNEADTFAYKPSLLNPYISGVLTFSNATEPFDSSGTLPYLDQDAPTGPITLNRSDFSVKTAGKGLRVKEGSNAKQGTATLAAGSVVVSNTSVTANSRIFLTSQADGGTPGWLRVSARVAGTSFTITSSSGTDTSTVAYQIFEPA